MSKNTPSADCQQESPTRLEGDKLKMNGKKVADVVKGVAVAYVGFQLGVAALRFLGRKLRGKESPGTRSGRPQPAGSTAHISAPQIAAGEDAWTVVDAAPPETPDGYKPIVTAVVPCTPQELYGILFSSAGAELYLKQHRNVGKQWDLVLSGWKHVAPGPVAAADESLLGPQSVFEFVLGRPAPGGFTRLLTFVNPKKPPSSIDTRCVQRQQFCVYSGGVLVFASAMNMLDIPFKECFTVNTMWRVAPGPTPGTSNVTINLKVHFIKRAMGVGGIIAATTFRDYTAFFTDFMANIESHVCTLREQAGAPLPAPLPMSAVAAGGQPSRGLARSISVAPRNNLSSPFATAGAGAAAPSAASSLVAHSQQLRQQLPAWKQVRALVVVAVLAFTFLHQLHLGRELAAMRGEAAGGADAGAGAAAAAAAAAATGSGLVGRAGEVLATALGPMVTAAGSLHVVLQALVDRVGGRVPAPVAPAQG